MSNKNPFEIRLEVLEMAKGLMERQYDDASALAWSLVENTAKYQNKTMEEVKEFYSSIKPSMYTPKEVIEKANELYSFVTKKD